MKRRRFKDTKRNQEWKREDMTPVDYGDHGDGEAGNDEEGAVEALWPRLLRV